MGENILGTMVSASIPDSTGHRGLSQGKEGVFFMILLLSTERESTSTANVGDRETDPLLEATGLNSEPASYQFTTGINFDQ
ncbi:hypothetical protein E6H20_02025 [Candidatus Bathyarchaeota archaeon]|nr:MAG: hypothetical protein E6H20_02025 [Candidatus Bathyarchaeota archaeon]